MAPVAAAAALPTGVSILMAVMAALDIGIKFQFPSQQILDSFISIAGNAAI